MDMPEQKKDLGNKNRNMKAYAGSKGFIMTNCEIIKKLGDSEAVFLGFLIGQLDYFEGENARDIIDGYFPVTVEFIFDKIGFKYNKQDRIKKKLKKLGLIDFTEMSSRYRNKQLHFKVDMEAVKTLVKYCKQDAGEASFNDKRFVRKSMKESVCLTENSKTDLPETVSPSYENDEVPLYRTPNKTPDRIVLSTERTKGDNAGALCLSSEPFSTENHSEVKTDDGTFQRIKLPDMEDHPATDYDSLDNETLLAMQSYGDTEADRIWLKRMSAFMKDMDAPAGEAAVAADGVEAHNNLASECHPSDGTAVAVAECRPPLNENDSQLDDPDFDLIATINRMVKQSSQPQARNVPVTS
jgi:hypothetical protein